MKETEQERTPDIKMDELLRIIDEVKLLNSFEFSYNGSNYLIILVTQEDIINSIEAGDEYAEENFYSRSTEIAGWDLYIKDSIKDTERKRVLFHEILETNLVDQGFETQEAHNIALKEEEKFFGSRIK
jgi:hypothetical protein